MLPRLFQLSHPVVLVDRDAGQPMLVRIKGLRKSPRSRGCQHRRPMLSSNTRFFLRILGSSWGACSGKVLPVMTLASSPRGDKRGVTLVMAGFTPNAVHPHGGRSASYFASKAACTAPPCLGPRKPEQPAPIT